MNVLTVKNPSIEFLGRNYSRSSLKKKICFEKIWDLAHGILEHSADRESRELKNWEDNT